MPIALRVYATVMITALLISHDRLKLTIALDLPVPVVKLAVVREQPRALLDTAKVNHQEENGIMVKIRLRKNKIPFCIWGLCPPDPPALSFIEPPCRYPAYAPAVFLENQSA